jgi:hypothetical protein
LSRIIIAPIVEGHGEDQAVRNLLQRVWTEVLGGEHAEIIKAIRVKRYSIVREEDLARAVDLACLKLDAAHNEFADRLLILILLDADSDLPCVLGPELEAIAKRHRGDVDVTCVIANIAYETWFVASAESLAQHLNLNDVVIPADPEEDRAGKGWIKSHFADGKYSETVDQPRLTAQMDLIKCRDRSKSFDKLCRELSKRLAPPD